MNEQERKIDVRKEMELRRAYREHIYNYRPPLVQKIGISFIVFFLVIILILAAFIKYPDTVTGIAEITTINPPANLVANVNGKLENILVEEGQWVVRGQPLVVMQSACSWEDIPKLEQILNELDSALRDTVFTTQVAAVPEDLQIGAIQASYSRVINSFHELIEYRKNRFYENKISAAQEQLKKQEIIYAQLSHKRSIVTEQHRLALSDLKRDRISKEEHVISDRAYELSVQNNDLRYRSILADLELEFTNNLLRQDAFKHDIAGLQIEKERKKQRLELALSRSINETRSLVQDWKNVYLLESPIDGRVSFSNYWSENQYVKAGDVIISVVPPDSASFKARIQFPIRNSGKVALGNRVNIKLEGYPYQEFGMLVGELVAISTVPKELAPGEYYYSADVVLVNGPVTTYGQKLPKVQQMIGSVEILTDDLSLLMRFFNPVRALIDEHL